CFALRLGRIRFDNIGGIARVMPFTSFGIVLGGLSLIGAPGTAGFISKWYLVLAALESSQWWIAFAIMLSSLLAVIYVWRFVEAAYFREPDAKVAKLKEAPLEMLVPAWLMVAACFYFGLDTSLTVDGAAQAAATLLQGIR
ncbi:MAG: proton-conducting transporter membrane subunit, partial [Burkholderiales bacterium]|nr:proton-conducting transporter membrane subunit [Burkholderiales bacterium]